MAKNILTAKVAIVRFGSIEIEGLLFDDGRYGVAVQQAATLFQLRQDNAQRDIKRLLGKDSSFVKVDANREQIEQIRVRSAENALVLIDFEKLIVELTCNGNKTAQALRKVFPQDLSGLYTPDEMAQTDISLPVYAGWKTQSDAIDWAVGQTGLEREWLESEFVALPAVNSKKAQAWVEFIGSCAKLR